MQLKARPGIIELGFGQPDPALLPHAAIRSAAEVLVGGRQLAEALSYGAERGPEELIEALADRIGETERKPSRSELVITGGNSQALDELLTLLARPGDRILVEAPTYNFALAIIRSHGLVPIGVPTDQHGMQIDRLEEVFELHSGEGHQPRLLYVIPTFHNPTGISLSSSRRRDLLSFASSHGLTVIEDDAYRELAYEGDTPESLWSNDPERVVRLGTFSKSLAPGLRVGWMTSSERVGRTLELAGLRQSGGGVNHFASMMAREVIRDGAYAATIRHLRLKYTSRRDALVARLDSILDRASFAVPQGGYFLWLALPTEIDTARLLPLAESEGVAFVPGQAFFPDGAGPTNYLRLSFTYYDNDVLEEGAERLGRAIHKL